MTYLLKVWHDLKSKILKSKFANFLKYIFQNSFTENWESFKLYIKQNKTSLIQFILINILMLGVFLAMYFVQINRELAIYSLVLRNSLQAYGGITIALALFWWVIRQGFFTRTSLKRKQRQERKYLSQKLIAKSEAKYQNVSYDQEVLKVKAKNRLFIYLLFSVGLLILIIGILV